MTIINVFKCGNKFGDYGWVNTIQDLKSAKERFPDAIESDFSIQEPGKYILVETDVQD